VKTLFSGCRERRRGRVLYSRSGAPSLMGNYGSDDADNYTHVHIATDGGGYPNGNEIYVG
jgi:hypothetical protein